MSTTRAGESEAVWRPVSRTRAYELVVDRIEEQIVSGALRVGDRLPAERDLAGLLDVSRAAVREAIRSLEAQGVVRQSVGAGPDSGTVVVAMPSAALTRFMRLHVALANFPMGDVVEARVTLEVGSARLAAATADAETLSGLRELVEAMSAPGIDRATFNDLDTRFHVALAEAGHNSLVAAMTTAIRASMATPILHSLNASADWADLAAGLQAGHEAILAAVTAADPDAAARAVEAHIRHAYATLVYERE